MLRTARWAGVLTGIAVLFLSFIGCSKNSGDGGVDPSPATGRFLFVQASPDAPPAELYVDSVLVDTNIVYPENTRYIDFAAGSRTLRVVQPGSQVTLYLALVPVTAGWNYTIFGTDSAAKYNSLLLVDNLSTPGAGKANFRFVHVSPNAPSVDLVVQGGITLFMNETFKSKTDFIPLDAGTYSFDVKVSGRPTVLASATSISLAAGKIYTLYLRGFAGSSGNTALDTGLLVHN